MVNHNVTFEYTSFTSARVFIDQPSNATASSDADEPAAAYVLYSSFRQPSSINPINLSFPGTAVVNNSARNGQTHWRKSVKAPDPIGVSWAAVTGM